MLVLSRKSGQRIVIDGDIVVTILELRGQRARIGIEAPASVRICRDELTLETSASAAADASLFTPPRWRAARDSASFASMLARPR
jgi:carbon storage regulator